MICFDHIEVHVKNAAHYAEFLQLLFGNGRFKKISENNTYMFVSNDQIHIEIKENANYSSVFQINNGVGFCLPCLRMKGARDHLSKIPGISFIKEIQNSDGACIFFKDHENIDWHFKDYDCQDINTNI